MSNNLLKGKRGIIFGALDERSMAWMIAEEAIKQGATITLSNAPIALRMGKINELAEKCNTEVIAADATKVEDLENVFSKSMELLGGKIDFVLHSIGMSPNIRKSIPYTDINYEFMAKTIDISAVSFHKILQVAYKMDAMNEWGSIVALSYIAAQRTFPGYADMADTKAVLESIARSFGYYFGKNKKVRVNTISQSPSITSAGSGIKGFNHFFSYADKTSPLGNAPVRDCANYCITLFSDLTRMVTMQNLFHDGGFSTTGASEDVMDIVLNAEKDK